MFQMKEQDKTPEEELSEVEIGSLPEKEFRVMIVKKIKELGRRMDAQSQKLEVFNRNLESIKNDKQDFPGGSVVKNLPANAGDTGSIPGLGRSHMPWSN